MEISSDLTRYFFGVLFINAFSTGDDRGHTLFSRPVCDCDCELLPTRVADWRMQR